MALRMKQSVALLLALGMSCVSQATLAALSAWGILLEKSTNALVNKAIPSKKSE